MDVPPKYADGVLTFTDPMGTLLIALPGRLPFDFAKHALTDAWRVKASLAPALRNRAVVFELRRLVAQMTGHQFHRDVDLVSFVATAAAAHRLLVFHVRFVVGPALVAASKVTRQFDDASLYPDTLQRLPHLPRNAALDVASLSVPDRFVEVLRRTPRYLPEAAAAQFKELMTWQMAAATASTLAVYAAAHLIGIGEVGDAVLIAAGYVFLGRQFFDCAMKFGLFWKLTWNASSEADLEKAAAVLAEVIAIIGVAGLMYLVSRLAAEMLRGKAAGPEVQPKESSPTSPGKQPKSVVAGQKSLSIDPVTQATMDKYGLTPDSRVYRRGATRFVDLENMTVSGNPNSCARIQDPYNLVPNWRVRALEEAGIKVPDDMPRLVPRELDASKLPEPSLNVVGTSSTPYNPGSDHVTYSFRLGDALEQGGKIYPDTSAVAEGIKPLIITVPEGNLPIQLEK